MSAALPPPGGRRHRFPQHPASRRPIAFRHCDVKPSSTSPVSSRSARRLQPGVQDDVGSAHAHWLHALRPRESSAAWSATSRIELARRLVLWLCGPGVSLSIRRRSCQRLSSAAAGPFAVAEEQKILARGLRRAESFGPTARRWWSASRRASRRRQEAVRDRRGASDPDRRGGPVANPRTTSKSIFEIRRHRVSSRWARGETLLDE